VKNVNPEAMSEYLSALFLCLVGVYGIVKTFREYQLHGEPVKKFAKVLLASFFIFGIMGGLGVLLTVAVNPELWFLEALFVIVGYLILAKASLDLLHGIGTYPPLKTKGSQSQGKKLNLPSAGIVQSTKDAKLLLTTLANYIGVPVLAIGREHPDKWTAKMGVIPTEYVWITRVEHPTAVNPSSLHVLNGKITSFLSDNPGGVVYLEGVEYIALYVDSKSLLKFILSVRDTAIVYNGYFILLANPETLEPAQVAIFKRELEVINVNEILDRLRGTALFGVLPPSVKKKKRESNEDAGTEGSNGRNGENKEKTEESEPLRREEAAEERG
jgi:hypothetical protein